MAEVSGGVLLGGILLMLLLCMGQIRIAYLKEMPALLSGQAILRSFYGVLCAFSGIALLPFMLRDVEKRSTVGKTIVVGILTLAGLLAGILLLLPAVLGWNRLQQESYPVLPLLAGADLRETYWQGLMCCGWDSFFTVYFLQWEVCFIMDIRSWSDHIWERDNGGFRQLFLQQQ